MKKQLNLFLLIIIIFFQLKNVNANIQNKIIANVENEIISSYELKNKIRTILILNNEKISQQNIDKTKNLALRTLINLKLKRSELKKFEFLNKDVQTEDYIKGIARKYNLDIDGFKNVFMNNKLDFKLYRDEIETELVWQNLIFSIYGNQTNVNEEEVNEELKKIIKNQEKVFEYNLSEIELDLENVPDQKELINEVNTIIKEIGFENTAIKYSISNTSLDGGKLGWINSKSLSNRILDIVNKMKPGQISKPINQQNSLLIIKLNDLRKLELDKFSLKKTKEKILLQKKTELLNLYSSSHLSKIKNRAFIELK